MSECNKWHFLCLLNECVSDFKWPLPSALTMYFVHNGRDVDIMWKSYNSRNNCLLVHSVLFPQRGTTPIWHDPGLNKAEARAPCVVIRYRDARGQPPALGKKSSHLFSYCGNVRIYLELAKSYLRQIFGEI